MKKIISNNFCKEVKNLFKKYPIESSAIILLLCFFMGEEFEKNFAAVGSIGSLFIGYGAYRISKEQQRNTDFKIYESKKTIQDHYKKTSEVIAKTSNYWNGRHFNNDVQGKDDPTLQLLALMKSAEIELPDGFSQLIEEIFQFYNNLSIQLLDAKEKNIALGNKALENHKKESELRLKLENLYSKYLKIPN